MQIKKYTIFKLIVRTFLLIVFLFIQNFSYSQLKEYKQEYFAIKKGAKNNLLDTNINAYFHYIQKYSQSPYTIKAIHDLAKLYDQGKYYDKTITLFQNVILFDIDNKLNTKIKNSKIKNEMFGFLLQILIKTDNFDIVLSNIDTVINKFRNTKFNEYLDNLYKVKSTVNLMKLVKQNDITTVIRSSPNLYITQDKANFIRVSILYNYLVSKYGKIELKKQIKEAKNTLCVRKIEENGEPSKLYKITITIFGELLVLQDYDFVSICCDSKKDDIEKKWQKVISMFKGNYNHSLLYKMAK